VASYGDYARMESGMWWRTRTVAEGMATGTFLRLSCACGRIADFPFALLLHQRRRDPGHLPGEHRLQVWELRRNGPCARRSVPVAGSRLPTTLNRYISGTYRCLISIHLCPGQEKVSAARLLRHRTLDAL
jgi:hypothetical protein